MQELFEEWRPAQEESVKQTIVTRRAERQDRYQQVVVLSEQGLTAPEIALRLGMKARTVRDWLHKGVAPDSRQRRKFRERVRSPQSRAPSDSHRTSHAKSRPR